MEDGKSEIPKAMEETQDSCSWDEWTIIHDEQEKKDIPGAVEEKPHDSIEDNPADALAVVEQAREVIEEIDPSTLENFIDPSETRDDDSDGVSVITDSDKGETTIVQSPEQTIPRIPPYLTIFAACCLAAAIGFGIGCVVGTGNTQFPPPNVRMTPATAFEALEEAPTDVSGDVTIEIDSESLYGSKNAHAMDQRAINRDHMTHTRHDDILENLIEETDQNLNMRYLKNSLQRLKLSLDTLCSLLDEDERSRHGNVCNENSGIFEIIGLESTVRYLVNEFQSDDDIGMKQLIEHIDLKINRMVSSFFDRVSSFMGEMRRKLYRSICLIRNTYSNGEKIQQVLDQRSISIDSCKVRSTIFNERNKKFGRRDVNSTSGETSDIVSAEIESTQIPKNNRYRKNDNPGKKNGKSEEYRKKKHSREDSYKNSQKNDFNKSKSNNREFTEESDEQNDFYSPENGRNNDNNEARSKKKYKQSKNSNEYVAENSVENSSEEDRREYKNGDRNNFKSSKKYGTPKGEPKENFVEKKHGNNYEANEDKENENYCYSKKCSKNHDSEEKNKRKGNGKNGQWQFERAREREHYRSHEDDVWYNARTRARERARFGF